MNVQAEKWITLGLGGTCGALLLLVAAFELGVGTGYSWDTGSADSDAAMQTDKVDRSAFKLASREAYAEIENRPLFNDDRRPTPPPQDSGEVAEEGPTLKPPPALKLRLSGVMITPTTRVVMISDNGKNPSAVVKEGAPLPGELSAWTLAEIKPRSAVFRGSGGENVELELEAGAQKPPPPTPPAPPPGQNAAAAAPPDPAAPTKLAGPAPGTTSPGENLQQRIDERRKQLREKNQQMHQATNPRQTPPSAQQ